MTTLSKIMIGVSALLLGVSITFITLFIQEKRDFNDVIDLSVYTVSAYTQAQDTLHCVVEQVYGDSRNCNNELDLFEIYSNNMYKIGISKYNFD